MAQSTTNNWSFQPLHRQRSTSGYPQHVLNTVPETAVLTTPPPTRKPLTIQIAGVAAAESGHKRRFLAARKKPKSAMKMLADTEREEALNLQIEFEWVLRQEVHAILKQLRSILVECAHRFPVPLYENEGKKTE
nr:RE74101p [Drosophila melanogaster]